MCENISRIFKLQLVICLKINWSLFGNSFLVRLAKVHPLMLMNSRLKRLNYFKMYEINYYNLNYKQNGASPPPLHLTNFAILRERNEGLVSFFFSCKVYKEYKRYQLIE